MDNKTFVVRVAIREQDKIIMDLARKASIKAQSKAQSGVQIGALIFDKAPTEVPTEYSNYSNIFSMENIVELPKNTRINEHAIKLEEDKQPLFGPIYSLGLVELETLKTYIKTNLANNLIWPSNSPAEILIFFDWKPDRSLRLYVNY